MIALIIIFLGIVTAKYGKVWEGGPNCAKGTTIAFSQQSDAMYSLPRKVPGKIRIAFVGDSITKGGGTVQDNQLEEDGMQSYLLNGAKQGFTGFVYKFWQMLEDTHISDQYEILNFGFEGRHMRKIEAERGDFKSNSYFQSCDYQQVLKSEPNAVVLMLGTNDILHISTFQEDKVDIQTGLLELARKLKNLPSRPTLYVMIPGPVLWRGLPKDQYGVWPSTMWLPNLIREVSSKIPIASDHVINLQEIFTPQNAPDLLDDCVHPNAKGHKLIAQKVYNTVIYDQDNHKELRDTLYKIGNPDFQL